MKRYFLLIQMILLFTSSIESQELLEDQKAIIDKYNNIGYDFLAKGSHDSAEYYLLKTLELQKSYYGDLSEETIKTYINLGVLYRNLNNFEKALDYYNLAEKYTQEILPNSQYTLFIYINKGNIYYSYSDYLEAENYYKYCIEYLSRNEDVEHAGYDKAYLNLYNILITQNKIDEALQLLNGFEWKIDTGEVAFKRHIYLAETYYLLRDYDKAIEESKQAKKIFDESFPTHIPNLIIYNYRIAQIYIETGEFDKAYSALLNSLEHSEVSERTNFEKLYQTYLLIGNLFYVKGEYQNCVTWLEDKIINHTLSEIMENPSSNIYATKSFNREVIDLYRLHGKALFQQYLLTKDINLLKSAFDSYSKGIEFIKIFRIHMRNEASIHFATASRIELFHEAIDIAYELYKYTNEYEYLDLAFRQIENIKSFSLLSGIKKVEIIEFSDLPKEKKEREAHLSREISLIDAQINKLLVSESLDYDELAILNESKIRLKDDYNTLLDSIEKLYPNYFDLKYNPHFLSPIEVQAKLNRKEALVEYVLADTSLTTVIIDKQNIQIIRESIDTSFASDCQEYFELLHSQDFSKDVHHTYERYITLGKSFYDILVKPVLERTESRDITFVPDAEIMYLPFESFITRDVDKQYINYHDLPYLIYDVSIGYSYSSTLLFSDRVKTHSPKHKVLAFAPNYENLHDPIDPIEWNREANPDFLLPLKGAKKEVEFISKRVPSVAFMDSVASEANFKKYASDYYVLHLAMHTIMDDKEPMHSKLAFTRNFNDTTEDHDLFTYEIYNMKLNAEMIVLSSCSSGYGKMQKGEGMMSMSRGFMYAGCPSIIMTLWQISDRSSSELMSSFYKHLKKGKSKKKALRQAKIDYIKSSDRLKSNPYFWSAFMVVGDTSPLYGRGAGFYLILLIVGFLVIVGLTYRKQVVKRFRG